MSAQKQTQEQKAETAAVDAPASKAGFDLFAAPDGTVKNSPQMNDLIRMLNGGERQLAGALDQLAASSRGTPETGASEFYAQAAADLREMVSMVRVAQFNHQKFVQDRARR